MLSFNHLIEFIILIYFFPFINNNLMNKHLILKVPLSYSNTAFTFSCSISFVLFSPNSAWTSSGNLPFSMTSAIFDPGLK